MSMMQERRSIGEHALREIFRCSGPDGREYTIVRTRKRSSEGAAWSPPHYATLDGQPVVPIEDGMFRLGRMIVHVDCA